MSVETDKINDLTVELIKGVGTVIGSLDKFESEMVVIEGLVAGLIASAAIRYNRQPEEIVEALTDGIRERYRLSYLRK
jgi:hypothetical protein